eukprot:1195613-Pyramimonas_sp.AAC.1
METHALVVLRKNIAKQQRVGHPNACLKRLQEHSVEGRHVKGPLLVRQGPPRWEIDPASF